MSKSDVLTKKSAFCIEDDKWIRLGIGVVMQNERREPGRWLRRTYYSTHTDPKSRLRMHVHRSPKGNYAFSFNRGQAAAIERLGGGESLVHYLHKIAISELSETVLKVKRSNLEIPIRIIDSATESRVHVDDHYYDIDVGVRFESDTEYELKWGGQLGVEVHHTNPVEGKKLEDLNRVRVPIVEVDVSEKFAPNFDEESSTPEVEREYIEFLKGRLSEYLLVKIISNPSSEAFLEKEVASLRADVSRYADSESAAVEDARRAWKELSNTQGKLSDAMMRLRRQENRVEDLQARVRRFEEMGIWQFMWLKVFRK